MGKSGVKQVAEKMKAKKSTFCNKGSHWNPCRMYFFGTEQKVCDTFLLAKCQIQICVAAAI